MIKKENKIIYILMIVMILMQYLSVVSIAATEISKANLKNDHKITTNIQYKNSDGINVYELVTIHDEKQYVFMYSAKDENYDENKAEFLFNNVKFLDN